MTIQMRAAWGGFEAGAVTSSFGATEEARLIAAGLARDYTPGMDGRNPVLSNAQLIANQALVSGAWILDGATAGQSTAWLPLIGGGFRLAYALDSGTTTTGFSVDISADGSTSLGQAFTGSYASSTAFEDTGQRLVSNVNATHFRFNVLSGGPLSVKRLA